MGQIKRGFSLVLSGYSNFSGLVYLPRAEEIRPFGPDPVKVRPGDRVGLECNISKGSGRFCVNDKWSQIFNFEMYGPVHFCVYMACDGDVLRQARICSSS